MNNLISFLIGFIVASILIISSLGCYRHNYEDSFRDIKHDKIKFSEYRPKVGDIIFRTRLVGRPMIQFALGTYFDHYAIVVMKDGQYYMLDINYPGAYYENSTDMVSLLPMDFIQKSNDSYYVVDGMAELSAEQNDILLSLTDYKYPPIVSLLRDAVVFRPTNPNDKRQNCLDLMAIALDKIRVVDIKHMSMAGKAKYLSTKFGPVKQLV